MTNEQLNTILETYKKAKNIFIETVKETMAKELKNPEILKIDFTDLAFDYSNQHTIAYGNIIYLSELEDEKSLLAFKVRQKTNSKNGFDALKDFQKIVKDHFTEQQLTVLIKYFHEKNCLRIKTVTEPNDKIKILELQCFYRGSDNKRLRRAIPAHWTPKEIAAYILATGNLPDARTAMKLAK